MSVKFVQAVLVTSITVVIAVCYAIAIPAGLVDTRSFYLSYIFKEDPPRAIASFGLPIAAVSAYMIFLARYLYADSITSEDSSQRLKWMNGLAGWSCTALIGLGAVTMDTLKWLHGFFAFSMFVCTTVALLLMAVEDYRVVYRRCSVLVLLRLASAVTVGLSLFAMLYGFSFDIFIASVSELVFVGFVMLSLTSYSREFESYRIELSLTRVS